MAGRKQTNTAAYFLHFAQHKKTMFVLEQKFKNDGYAVWFKLLELLAGSENHYLDCNAADEWQFIVSKMNIEETVLLEIFDLLVKLSAIDAELWSQKIVWCQNLVNNLKPLYDKRGREIPDRPLFCPRNTSSDSISVPEMQQVSIVSIEEKETGDSFKNSLPVNDQPSVRTFTGIETARKIIEDNYHLKLTKPKV